MVVFVSHGLTNIEVVFPLKTKNKVAKTRKITYFFINKLQVIRAFRSNLDHDRRSLASLQSLRGRSNAGGFNLKFPTENISYIDEDPDIKKNCT